MSFTDPFSSHQHSSGLRIGDAERDQAAEALRRHHSEGRLSDAEFEQRVSRCYAARTAGELEHLFADLPRGQRLSVPTGSGELWRGHHPFTYVAAAIIALWAIGGAFATVVGPWAPDPHPFFAPLILAFVVWRLLVRRHRRRVTSQF